ncbi:GAF and ANTAR domain-containing protein [Nocardia sp. XZ_19_369]|uniref:GAF and ANTAR domain-containing protein n=1 Tax=Nocardia sp. XZ_19_369 TaxID=2769487 RepID=UPI00189092C8|nr:GAF and ANTAR domain-containing protein [Nocardia sp. XZ_19_369]
MAEELALGMSELTSLLLTGDDVTESLCAAADIVARMLPDHPMTGITLAREHGIIFGRSSDAHAMLVEESEFSEGYGPTLQAISTAQQVSVPDVAAEHRWGDYSKRMLAFGVNSIHAQPLSVNGVAIGALSLYSPRPHSFTDQIRRAAILTTEHLGVLLAVASDTARQAKLTEQLRATLASRSTIDQALGIVMAERRCTRDAAFEVLRGRSQRRNVRVADLAAEIIEVVTGRKPTLSHFAEPAAPSRQRRR